MDRHPLSPRIALVVATHARPSALATLLASVRRQTVPSHVAEAVIVVDGVDEHEAAYGALLGAAERELPFALRWVIQENAGQASARHRGIRMARAPFVCVVDDDMDLAPGFLAAHLAALERGAQRLVVIGRVIPEDGWERAPLYEAVRTKHMLEDHAAMARGARRPSGFMLVTQNVSFPRSFYDEVGGFDERLRLGEDTELGLRLERAGGVFVFAGAAEAVHRSRVGSYEAWLRRCMEYGRSGVFIHRKLGGDARTHFLRNLVNGSRLNAVAVYALCWSDGLAHRGIAGLRRVGGILQGAGLTGPAIATHKAIMSIAYHLGVKRALGSWERVRAEARAFASTPGAPVDPIKEAHPEVAWVWGLTKRRRMVDRRARIAGVGEVS